MDVLLRYIIPGGLLAANLIIKFIFLTEPAIGGDEPFTIFFAQADYSTIWEMLQTENNPPLFMLLLKHWMELFGNSAEVIRTLPVILSSLTVLVIYRIGREFFSNFVAVFAAVLFTFSNYHIGFAHEARPYALFGLLTTLSMLLFLQQTIKNKNRWILLGIVNSLLIYNHFFGFFVPFVQFFVVITNKSFRESWKPVAFSWGITLLTYLPYVGIVFSRFSASSDGTWLAPPTFESLYDNLWRFSNAPVNTALFLILLAFATILFFARKKPGTPQAHYLFTCFLIPYLLMFGLSFRIPMFLDKYLVHISIAWYLLLAIALDFLSERKVSKLLLAGVLTVNMIITVNLKSGYNKQEKELVEYVASLKNEKTAVVLTPDWFFRTFSFHYRRDYFDDYRHTISHLQSEHIYPVNCTKELRKSISDKDFVIFVNTGANFANTCDIPTDLSTEFKQLSHEEKFAPFGVTVYQRK